MKMLHAAALLEPSSGIISQMRFELAAAQRIGFEWRVAIYGPTGMGIAGDLSVPDSSIQFKNRPPRIVTQLAFSVKYHIWLLKQSRHYDLLMLRYRVYDPVQLLFAWVCRKPICFVHHTMEVQELALSRTLAGRVKQWLERVMGPSTIRRSSAIIGVTKEIAEYEQQRAAHYPLTCLYPNGIEFSAPDGADMRTAHVEILFTASHFYPWHGLDLLLQALADDETQFTLHLVGTLSEADQRAAAKDARIVTYGHMSTADIRQLANRCWIGLSSFALHRIGLKEACTLKVREYLMMGLPVYSGHSDVFPPNFPYFRTGSISLSHMLQFARSVRTDSRDVVAMAAKPYIDKLAQMRTLAAAIKTICS